MDDRKKLAAQNDGPLYVEEYKTKGKTHYAPLITYRKAVVRG
jgi:hypothetical protein